MKKNLELRMKNLEKNSVNPCKSVSNNRNSKLVMGGFTLTEVLLVVVIIALVGGVGGGIYVGTHKRMEVEKAARDFLLTAQYARIMAIEQQSRYTMQLDSANNRFWLETGQPAAPNAQHGEWNEEAGQVQSRKGWPVPVIVQDYYCRPVEFTGDVKFEDVLITPTGLERAETNEGDTIVFLPNGSASSAIVRIGDGKTHYAISVDAATGRATMYFGTTEKIQTSSVDLDAE
jgi:prepilin-type N-terminal cleavage/methylation domain-containing protein